MHLLKHGFSEYVRRALELAEVSLDRLKLREYEKWRSYQAIDSQDRLQGAEARVLSSGVNCVSP